MDIKTTSEVIKFAIQVGVIGEYNGMILCKSDRDKKWVCVDDVLSYLKDNKIPNTRGLSSHGKGFKEGANTVIKVMELHLKRSNSTDKCSHCGEDLHYDDNDCNCEGEEYDR